MRAWARRLAVLAVLAALVVVLALGARMIVGWSTRARLEASLEAFVAAHGASSLTDLAPPPVPEAENVAPALLALIEELGATDDEWRDLSRRATDLLHVPLAQWSEEQHRTAEEFVAACGPIERYEELARRRSSDFQVDYAQGWDAQLPLFWNVFGIGRCALFHGRAGIASGDLGRFEASYLTLTNIARGLRNEPMLISQGLGMSIDRHRYHLLHSALERGTLDLPTLETLLALDEPPAARAGVALALEAEALLVASTPSRALLEDVPDMIGPFYSRSLQEALTYLLEPKGDLIRLAAIENRRREIESLERQAVELFRALDDGTFYDAEHLLRDQLAPNIENLLLRAYATDTVEAVARTALAVARDLATGRSGIAAPDLVDPMSGEPLTVRSTGTHVVVAAPGAAAVWEARAKPSGSPPMIFVWPVAHQP